MLDFMRRMAYLGLGAFSMTKEKAEQIVDELVKKGELNQQEAKEFVDKLIERGQKEQAALREMMRQEMAKLREDFSLVNRKEWQELEERVAKLEEKIAQISAGE